MDGAVAGYQFNRECGVDRRQRSFRGTQLAHSAGSRFSACPTLEHHDGRGPDDRSGRAGTPTTTAPSSTSLVTTAPAPTVAPGPIAGLAGRTLRAESGGQADRNSARHVSCRQHRHEIAEHGVMADSGVVIHLDVRAKHCLVETNAPAHQQPGPRAARADTTDRG